MRTRLTLPVRFTSEKAAASVLRANSLYSIGAQAIPADNRWYIIIDTAKPDAVCRYLGQHMPGVEWQRSELL